MGMTERREREREEVRREDPRRGPRPVRHAKATSASRCGAIADAIEYSPTTIYNHFEDKDDLVHALCQEDFAPPLRAPAADSRRPAIRWRPIRQLGLAYARFGIDLPEPLPVHVHDPGQVRAPGRARPLPASRPSALLRARGDGGHRGRPFRPGDVDTVAQVLWASMHGAVALLITLQPQHWPHAPAAPDLVEQVVDATIRGFLADARAQLRTRH